MKSQTLNLDTNLNTHAAQFTPHCICNYCYLNTHKANVVKKKKKKESPTVKPIVLHVFAI